MRGWGSEYVGGEGDVWEGKWMSGWGSECVGGEVDEWVCR